jgi:IS605 OrfB family transposase
VSVVITQAAKGKALGSGVKACARLGGQTRYLWNLCTALNNERMKVEGKFVFGGELSAMLPKLLKTDPKLQGLPHRAAQMQTQNFDKTLKYYIEHKAEFQRIDAKRKAKSAARVAKGLPPLKPKKSGIPQFKRRDDRTDSFSFVGRECKIEPRRVKLPNIGWVSVRGLDIPQETRDAHAAIKKARAAAKKAGTSEKIVEVVKSVHLTQEPDGWHIAIMFDGPAKEAPAATKPVIGIDHGLTALAAWSDGTMIEPPRHARKAEKRIRRLNRERDRRRKGSVNRKRTVVRLGRAHRRVRHLRQDFMHKLTRRMVNSHAGFAVEDLCLKGLMKTRLAKSFADASLGELLRMLRYKSEWACREWRVLGRFQRSTGVCPDPCCGWVGPRLRPGIKTWTCEGCGVVYDRDTAAGQVILRDATMVRAIGVPPARREPVGVFRRKRSPLPRVDGIKVGALVSRDGPLSNIVDTLPLDEAA